MLSNLAQYISVCRWYQFLISNESIKTVQTQINLNLKYLVKWLNANKISLNASKTNVLIFRHQNKPISYISRSWLQNVAQSLLKLLQPPPPPPPPSSLLAFNFIVTRWHIKCTFRKSFLCMAYDHRKLGKIEAEVKKSPKNSHFSTTKFRRYPYFKLKISQPRLVHNKIALKIYCR